MNKAEVLKLATLARIEISDAEAESLSHEFEAILNYVGEVKGATDLYQPSPNLGEGKGEMYNVFRADENPHESGKFTEAILKEAPAGEGDFIKVKKII
jgi:aspartyl/glutamyl-tRNA(Asn/Gln) amidotransferase C subunit